MKEIKLIQKRSWRTLSSILALAVCLFFAACENQELRSNETWRSDEKIFGDYQLLDLTLINAEKGLPQKPNTLKKLIGEEISLLPNGDFKSAKAEGSWTKNEVDLTIYPPNDSEVNLVIIKTDDQYLTLTQELPAQNGYAKCLISYTYIKKGSEISVDQWLKL
ncbi:MAG: hypothetical protein AAFY45_29220 [Bacteroidota bacterium]